jgi:spermidine synthase
MAFGRNMSARQSCVLLSDRGQLVFNYSRMMMAALYLNPKPKRVLILGLGGGTLVTAFQTLLPDAAIDAAEIDPAVVRMAREYFDLDPAPYTRIYAEDGRVFVKRMQRRGVGYDLIVLDAFDHEYIPEHMLTREFLLEVKSLLGEHGVLAANTFSVSKLYDHESARITASSAFLRVEAEQPRHFAALGRPARQGGNRAQRRAPGAETAAARRRPRVAVAADRDRAGLARRYADPDRSILAINLLSSAR